MIVSSRHDNVSTREGVYYHAIISFSLDYSITFEDRLILIEQNICTLDELFLNGKHVFVRALFSKTKYMSETTIERLRPYVRSLFGCPDFIENVELAVKIVHQLETVDVFFNHASWRLFNSNISIAILAQYIHKIMMICVELDQTRTLDMLGLDELNSNITTHYGDAIQMNRVWWRNGKTEDEKVNLVTRNEYMLAFRQQISQLCNR